MQTLIINALPENKGDRLDKFIADNSDISRSYAAKLCEDGLVTLGEKVLAKKYKISGNEEIVIEVPEPEPEEHTVVYITDGSRRIYAGYAPYSEISENSKRNGKRNL